MLLGQFHTETSVFRLAAPFTRWCNAFLCAFCALLTVCVIAVCLQEAESLVSAVLPPDKQAAAPEIALYLKESVGNATRIDYGTGIAFLGCFFPSL